MGAARRPHRRLAVAALAALALAVGSACATGGADDSRSATAGMPDLAQTLGTHEWVLDPAASSLTETFADPVTLTFESERVAGRGPCNTYGGSLHVDHNDAVEISDVFQTKMACEPAVMDAEAEYLEVLQRVRDVEVTGGYDPRRIVLSNDAGDRLSFEAAERLAPS